MTVAYLHNMLHVQLFIHVHDCSYTVRYSTLLRLHLHVYLLDSIINSTTCTLCIVIFIDQYCTFIVKVITWFYLWNFKGILQFSNNLCTNSRVTLCRTLVFRMVKTLVSWEPFSELTKKIRDSWCVGITYTASNLINSIYNIT